MVAISTSSKDSNDKYRRRRRNPLVRGLVFAVATVALLFVLLSVIRPATGRTPVQEVSQQAPLLRQQQKQPSVMPNTMIQGQVVRDMAHEPAMHQTIRDCLPAHNKKCKTFVPEPITGADSAEKVQRVALIAPPGKLSARVLQYMQAIAQDFNQRPHRPPGNDAKIHVFETTHVPPYGYGKSHGLTKIVKLMPQPILLQVTDTLETLSLEEPSQTVSGDDLQVALLQVLRFHCRLSHVAAHTASLTISDQALQNDTQLGLELFHFMVTDSGSSDPPSLPAHGGVGNVESLGAELLTRVAKQVAPGDETNVLLDVLDQVLQGEMQRTKDMSVWPCPSFWDPPAPLQLSDVTQQLARALSPNCDDPYVSCFVKKDKCEAAGDAVCKK